MGGFFKGVWLGLKTLVTRPIQYLTNPVEATTEVYKDDLAKEGLSMAEIDQAVKAYEDSGGPITDIGKGYGAVTEGIGKAIKSVANIIGFAGKNFTIVIIIVLLVVGAWYFFMFRKAAQ